MTFADSEQRRKYNREYLRKRRAGVASGVTARSIWTADRWARAQEMREEGYPDSAIAKEIGLTVTQVHNKFGNESYGRQLKRSDLELQMALAERDARNLLPRTLTEMICGDPLPGRSALDKKRAEPGR